MGIKVVATQKGYYERLIEVGQLFEIPSEKWFSKRWMKKFDAKADKTAPVADPKPVRRMAAKPIEPKTLKDVTDNTPKDNDWME